MASTPESIAEESRGVRNRGLPQKDRTIDPRQAMQIEADRLKALAPATYRRPDGSPPERQDFESFSRQYDQMANERHVWRFARPDGSTYETSWRGLGTGTTARAFADLFGHRVIGEVIPGPIVDGTPARDPDGRGVNARLTPPPLVQAEPYSPQLPVKKKDPGKKKKKPPILPPGAPPQSASAHGPIVVPWKRQNKEIEELKFAARNPDIASTIGFFLSGSINITTTAARLAVRSGLDNTKPGAGEGTEVNAVRHTTWQAIITDTFGQGTAEEVAIAHEEFPDILNGISDPAAVYFITLSHADTAADTMNNRIGRLIALLHPKLDRKGFALEVLKYFHTTGLWVASKNVNGLFSIVQTKLSASRYQAAVQALQQLDADGFTASELANIKRQRERRMDKETTTKF